MTKKGDHKTCSCGRRVPVQLWFLQRGKNKLPTCPICVAKEKLRDLKS